MTYHAFILFASVYPKFMINFSITYYLSINAYLLYSAWKGAYAFGFGSFVYSLCKACFVKENIFREIFRSLLRGGFHSQILGVYRFLT